MLQELSGQFSPTYKSLQSDYLVRLNHSAQDSEICPQLIMLQGTSCLI